MHDQPSEASRAASPEASPPSGLLNEIGQFGRAFKALFGAQLHLLGAELGLAREAISWLLVAGLGATVAGVGLALSLLAFLGVLLAKWFGSWLFALAALCVLQVLFLIGAIVLFRRCMHWMSLPATRDQWGAMMDDTLRRVGHPADAADSSGEEHP
jgi:uncharacterized membrane protein YqjE